MASSRTGVRIPPQHTDAEKALLGSIMLRSEVLYNITDRVRPETFYAQKHRMIYSAMLELHQKNQPIDLLTLSTKLEEKNDLEAIGGLAYLSELVNAVPSASNAEHYSEIVEKKYLMRSLIEAAEHISNIGYDDEREVDHVLDEAEAKIYAIANNTAGKTVAHIKEGLHEAWERLDRLHNSGDELRGVPSGYKSLDEKLSGFQQSDLIILAARPSMGKTSLALDIARKAAVEHNMPVGIFSLEMSTQQLIDRMLAAESSVDAWRLRTGKLTRDVEFQYLRTAMDRLSKAPIYIHDQPGINILTMRSAARRLKSEHDLKLIIVDYLQLMTPLKNTDSMVQQVTEISRSLKGLAKELNIPVIALSQLSRAVEQRGGRPRLSDLRDSGSIEQDADVVMFIHRDDKQNENSERPNIAEILIEKHRNGPTGKVELYFDEKKTTFRELESHRPNSAVADDF
jgi:replicative DNA helicase